MRPIHLTSILIAVFLLAACKPTQEDKGILVSLVADGRERTFSLTTPVTVEEFLRDPKIDVQLGPLDRVSPEKFIQVADGMKITVVRVTETTECKDNDIPFERRTVPNEGLSPGTQQIGQAGQNGVEEVCYRVRTEDGVRRDPVEISRVVKKEAQPEIVFVGPTGAIDPVPIPGTLAYIGNGNAWIMRGSSTAKHPLTETGDLDPRVFSLSPDGHELLFTRKNPPGNQETAFNQLWLLSDTSANNDPIRLTPGDVLYGDWVPDEDNTISYSTGEARQTAPGWQALNDLWIMRIDPQTGKSLKINQLVKPSCSGLYCWWGTLFQWSPDGKQLAWIRADSVGLVDLKTGDFSQPLLKYAVFRTTADWSWRASVSWSSDGNLLTTTVHGAPVGSEPPEASPAFDVAVTDAAGDFRADVVDKAGIWSSPSFSPLIPDTISQFPKGYLAYLKARDLADSINDQAAYDLFVTDRDGSNAHKVFPADGQPGLTAFAKDFVWSPDGRQIALIYRGNLWVIDVESQVPHQLTLDGGASKPVWTR
jgi:hypothetical protein